MSTLPVKIQRLLYRARPAKHHPKYFEWQTAHVCIFIAENDQHESISKADAKLREERWEMIDFEGGSTLIEERVRADGGAVWEAHLEARAKGVFFAAWPDGILGDKRRPMMLRAPRLTESFIDKVVERAGGRRLTAEECNNDLTRNADYLLDDRVMELKILEEEGLEKETRQEKLAALFGRPVKPLGTVEVDPDALTDEQRRKYCDIVGGPIQNAVKSASKQIRSTKQHLKNDKLRGVAVFVNTGYGTLPPDLLYPIVDRYAKKDTTQVKDVVAISSWLEPGELFDSTLYFQFQPEQPADPTLRKFHRAFWDSVNDFMTDFARGGFEQKGDLMDPLKPVTFEQHGIVFAAIPPHARRRNQGGANPKERE